MICGLTSSTSVRYSSIRRMWSPRISMSYTMRNYKLTIFRGNFFLFLNNSQIISFWVSQIFHLSYTYLYQTSSGSLRLSMVSLGFRWNQLLDSLPAQQAVYLLLIKQVSQCFTSKLGNVQVKRLSLIQTHNFVMNAGLRAVLSVSLLPNAHNATLPTIIT